MSYCIVGIDTSSKKINLVGLGQDSRVLFTQEWESKHRNFDERFFELIDKFEEFANNVFDVICFLESPIYIQNMKATIALSQVVAGVKYILHRRNISCFTVDNKAWKSGVLGDGKADKTKIMQFAKAKWEREFGSQDEADAACIALWGLMRIGLSREI